MTAPGTSTAQVRPGRLLAGATVVGVVVMALCLWTGDGRPAGPVEGLPDAGPGTTWALPMVRTIADLALILTVGLLLAGAVLVPARDGVLTGARLRWTRAARWPALVVVVAVLAEIVLSLSNILAQPVPGVLDPALLWSFVRQIDVGRSLLAQAGLALVVSLCAYAVRTTTGAALTCLLALMTVVPPLLTSHSGTSSDHTIATSALMVHVLGVCLWSGGLAALVLLGTSDRRPLAIAVSRFSPLALWAAVAVAVSGFGSAWLRIASLSELVTTSYGRLVLLKIALLSVVSALGWWHRRTTVPRLREEPTRLLFLRVAAVEVLVMAATVGVAVALSRTPPPVSGEASLESLSPARLLLGFDLPPAPDVVGLLWGQARLDGFWITVCVLLVALYAMGQRRAVRLGIDWPLGRAVGWYVGIALLAATTIGGVATYGHVMFSAHMAQHMLLSMVVPIFLVLGAPITLALQTLRREPGRVGPREWLERAVSSRTVEVLTNPIVAAVLFLLGFYGVYFTSVFETLMASHWGHLAMNVAFLLVGANFYWCLIGIDPGPRRPPYLVRIAVLIVVMPLHSFFAIAMMSTTVVLAEPFYLALKRPYATDLLADQHLGAGIGWASGDIPMAIVIAVMVVQWMRSDEREARRSDAAQERAASTGEGTDELAEYNAYLASLDKGRRDDA